MPSNDGLERLSRYAAGELDPEEAAEVEALVRDRPDLARTLDDFRRIDAAALELASGGATLDDARAEALVKGALAGAPAVAPLAGTSRPWVMFGVGVAVSALFFVGYLRSSGPAAVATLAVAGGVTVNGRALEPGSPPRPFQPGDVLETSADGLAVVAKDGQAVLLPSNSRLANVRTGQDRYEVLAGTVVAAGDGLRLTAPSHEIVVDGRAIVSMEPGEGVLRVTEALKPNSSGGPVKLAWTKLGPMAPAAAVGGAVTLFVIDGHAQVTPNGAKPIEVREGERWQAGETAPARFALSAPEAQPGPLQVAAVSERLPVTPAPELLALAAPAVEGLRGEREALLREKPELEKKADGAERREPRNYFRLAPEELRASAEKGELRLRLPQVFGEGFQYDPEARDDAALRSEEEAALKEIYRASGERIREKLSALYQEIGGNAVAADILSPEIIVNELRNKALPGEYPDAIRKLARERAGLEPVSADGEGPAVLRAFRALWQEDDRVVLEVEKLLGPSRAERFLNHAKTSHSDHVFGVGRRKGG